MVDREVFVVTEGDLADLTEEEFKTVWTSLGLVVTARRRREQEIRDRATQLEDLAAPTRERLTE